MIRKDEVIIEIQDNMLFPKGTPEGTTPTMQQSERLVALIVGLVVCVAISATSVNESHQQLMNRRYHYTYPKAIKAFWRWINTSGQKTSSAHRVDGTAKEPNNNPIGRPVLHQSDDHSTTESTTTVTGDHNNIGVNSSKNPSCLFNCGTN